MTTKKIEIAYRSTCIILLIICQVGLLSLTTKALAATPTPTRTRTPTITLTKTPTPSSTNTPTLSATPGPYPAPATAFFITPNPALSRKVIIPYIYKPYVDMSYYLTTTTDIYGLGQKRGQQYEAQSGTQNGIVILDFGSPDENGGIYGTLLFDYQTFIGIPQIKGAMQAFAQGVWNGLGADRQSFLRIVIGTNSSGGFVTGEHGEAWGSMVNELNSWLIQQQYTSQIGFSGGSDMETNFRDPSEAREWASGYSSTAAYRLYNFGNASGCPLDYPPTEPKKPTDIEAQPCDTKGWTQADVLYVSWQSGKSWPLPEIYNTTGANAQQWYRIALYNYAIFDGRMHFEGTLSQFEACEQHRDPITGDLSPDCVGTSNTAQRAHHQLLMLLSSDPYDRVYEPLYWVSDIMWYPNP